MLMTECVVGEESQRYTRYTVTWNQSARYLYTNFTASNNLNHTKCRTPHGRKKALVINMALLALARWTQPNFARMASTRGRAQVLAIPYSHFCELGSWSLDAASIPYDEHAFAPGQNVLPMLSLRVAGPTKFLARTSAVTAVAPIDATRPSSSNNY